MVAVDKPPKVGSLRVLGANEPAPAKLEDVDGLLITVLGFKLTVSEAYTQIAFKEFPKFEDAFREYPKPRVGDVIFGKGLDGQAQVNNDHVDFV